jgi:hypothetical protein
MESVEEQRLAESLNKIEKLENEALICQQQIRDLNEIVEQKTVELREAKLAFLGARDNAIGSAAELGEIRFQLQEASMEIESLANQLHILHGSRTWKAGRFLLLPLRVIRKIIRILVS